MLSEQVLIRRAIHRDQRAFDQLYQRYHTQIYSIVASRTRDRDDVDDLVQMTFIKAFGALSTFRGEATFATWLTRIAVNTCLSHYRARWSQVGRLDDVNELDAVYCGASLESPEVAVLRKESWEQLVGGLKGLSRVYRQVMWMRFMQDRSYQEICDALDVPLGTVKTWLHRARRKLRVQFPDWREWVN